MIVVDASALVEWVLRTPAGQAVFALLQDNGGRLHAPSFATVEAANALRRLQARKVIDGPRAQLSFEAVTSLSLTRHDPAPLLARGWALR